MAKFHVGQEVWGHPLMSTYGSRYVPAPYVIRKVEEQDGETLYYMKGNGVSFKESWLKETEAEVVLEMVEDFKVDTFRRLNDFIANCKRIGCAEKAKEAIFEGGQLLLGTSDIATPRDLYIRRKPVPKYEIGQTVFGHLYDEYDLNPPMRLVISSVNVIHFGKVGHVPPHWEVLYHVKGHSRHDVNEELLFPTEEGAIMHDIERYRVGFKSSAYCITNRAEKLGIEAGVRQALQAQTGQLLLE